MGSEDMGHELNEPCWGIYLKGLEWIDGGMNGSMNSN